MNQSLIDNLISKATKSHKDKNFSDAEKLYYEILQIQPENINCLNYLGTLLAQTDRFNEAEELFLKAKKLEPQNPFLINNLGNIYNEFGKIDKAKLYYEKAIILKPNLVQANLNLGIISFKKKNYPKALNYLNKVIELEPNNIQSYAIIANIYNHLRNFKQTLECYKKIFKIDPENLMALSGTIDLFSTINLTNLSEGNSHDLLEMFTFLYQKININHNYLFNNAKKLIIYTEDKKKLETLIVKNYNLLNQKLVKKILKKKLFQYILQKSLIRDQFLEKFLCQVRKEILFSIQNKNESLMKEFFDFILSYAEQSFFNEYIFFQSNDEMNLIEKLKLKIENSKKINELEIAVFACYIPLYKSKIIRDKLQNYSSKNILFNDLIKMQIKDYIDEQKLKTTIKSFEISNKISKLVRNQYEENPYPRWRYANINPKANFLFELNSDISPNKIFIKNDFINTKTLIAGCGTGQQLARRIDYKGSSVLAVDLSISSLAFAKRKMQELNINNIEFLHLDLLKLENLKQKFDIIECVGVLHHLEDPELGLKVLLNILKPNGFLKLGLYSELARKHIIEARKIIKNNNFSNNIDEIRNFREMIKNNNNNSFQKLNLNFDFHTTSSVRDLIFHAQEHQFTIPKISKLIQKYNLEFLGFTNKSIKKDYSNFFKDDEKNTSLKNWNEFEIKYPDIFQGMYQFWIKKN